MTFVETSQLTVDACKHGEASRSQNMEAVGSFGIASRGLRAIETAASDRGGRAQQLRAGDPRRALMVSSARYSLPLAGPEQRKFDALGSSGLRLRVLACGVSSAASDELFCLAASFRPRVAARLLFFVRLPRRVARELAQFDPDVVFVQGTFEASCVL